MKKRLHLFFKCAVIFGFLFGGVSASNAQIVHRIMRGFRGNPTIHENLGGLRCEVGGCFVQYTPFDTDLEIRSITRLSYSYYKRFPISIEAHFVTMGTYYSAAIGLGSAYFINDRLALNYGFGRRQNWFLNKTVFYESKDYYFSVGATYMFNRDLTDDEDILGGIKYTYMRSLGESVTPVEGHYVTYIFGKQLTYMGTPAN